MVVIKCALFTKNSWLSPTVEHNIEQDIVSCVQFIVKSYNEITFYVNACIVTYYSLKNKTWKYIESPRTLIPCRLNGTAWIAEWSVRILLFLVVCLFIYLSICLRKRSWAHLLTYNLENWNQYSSHPSSKMAFWIFFEKNF
jgi:hypothetical protein